MLKKDLAAAGIPYEDGRFRDFHSLRGSLVTELWKSGANPKAVLDLTRHSDANLSLQTYARLRPDDERRALEGLPSLAPGEDEPAPLKSTGTDGSNLSSSLSSDGASGCSSVHDDATSDRQDTLESAVLRVVGGGGGGNRTRVHSDRESAVSSEVAGDCIDLDQVGQERLGALLGVESNADPLLESLIEAWLHLPHQARVRVAGFVEGLRAMGEADEPSDSASSAPRGQDPS